MYYKDKDGKPHQGPITEPHLSKLLNEGGSRISEEEFRAIQVSLNTPTESQISEAVDAARFSAYQKEADPIYLRWKRGDATESEWLAKIAEIKNRIPKGVMPFPI